MCWPNTGLERILAYVDRITYLEEGTIAIDAPAREGPNICPWFLHW
ncbi:MAG: hypothetical protein R3C44_06160 [Chloroflexota bacterium]